jgi:hypothetical protein
MRLICLLFLFFSLSLAGQSRTVVTIPSIAEEATQIWRTINDIQFFEEHGYTVHLPESDLITGLIQKARESQLDNEDYAQIVILLERGVYQKSDYQKGLEKIQIQLPLVDSLVEAIINTKRNWAFKQFDQYKVTLTLYGSGGSFNPDEGTILMLTTKAGQFKQYDNPANTLIHEIVHIGLEESIVQKYQLNHGFKERIVDTFVYLHFKASLPEYRIQNMGDKALDQYLQSKKDLQNLDQIVAKFTKK